MFENWGRPWYGHWPDATRDPAGREIPSVRSEWVRKAMEEIQVSCAQRKVH